MRHPILTTVFKPLSKFGKQGVSISFNPNTTVGMPTVTNRYPMNSLLS
ncbi:MAG: hypothetical protein ACI4E3_12760 [Candidatus Fimousia sp.]